MINKPKYSLIKNSKYALEGFIVATKNEKSFRIELILGLPIFFIIVMLDFSNDDLFKLISTYFLILIVELINSSIETTVDLVTKKKNYLAKVAKDIASSAVMLSIVLHCITWYIVLL